MDVESAGTNGDILVSRIERIGCRIDRKCNQSLPELDLDIKSTSRCKLLQAKASHVLLNNFTMDTVQ